MRTALLLYSKTSEHGVLKVAQSQIKTPYEEIRGGQPSEDRSKVLEPKSIRLMKPPPERRRLLPHSARLRAGRDTTIQRLCHSIIIVIKTFQSGQLVR